SSDFTGRGRRADVCEAAESGPPDRSPSVALNGGRGGTDGTTGQGNFRQGLFRADRLTAWRSVGQDQGHEKAFRVCGNVRDKGADAKRQNCRVDTKSESRCRLELCEISARQLVSGCVDVGWAKMMCPGRCFGNS